MGTEEVLNERGKTHGQFKDNAVFIQNMKDALRQHKKWRELYLSEREALDMIVHKIGRIMNGNPHFPDHWEDIAGYATLVVKELKPK